MWFLFVLIDFISFREKFEIFVVVTQPNEIFIFRIVFLSIFFVHSSNVPQTLKSHRLIFFFKYIKDWYHICVK